MRAASNYGFYGKSVYAQRSRTPARHVRCVFSRFDILKLSLDEEARTLSGGIFVEEGASGFGGGREALELAAATGKQSQGTALVGRENAAKVELTEVVGVRP
jgi:hypothetical protein